MGVAWNYVTPGKPQWHGFVCGEGFYREVFASQVEARAVLDR